MLTRWLGKFAPKGLRPADINVRDPRVAMRLIIGVLLLANLVVAVQVFYPFGGSAEQLQDELAGLQSQESRQAAELVKVKQLTTKIERGRKEGDDFLHQYFLPRRTASSILLTELTTAAKGAGVQTKAHQFDIAPIDGSDTLSLLTITGHYEGKYGDLVHFLNELDRADRLMIIDSMTAEPTNTAGVLGVNLKMHAFIQEDGSAPPLPAVEGGENATAGAKLTSAKGD